MSRYLAVCRATFPNRRSSICPDAGSSCPLRRGVIGVAFNGLAFERIAVGRPIAKVAGFEVEVKRSAVGSGRQNACRVGTRQKSSEIKRSQCHGGEFRVEKLVSCLGISIRLVRNCDKRAGSENPAKLTGRSRGTDLCGFQGVTTQSSDSNGLLSNPRTDMKREFPMRKTLPNWLVLPVRKAV